MKLTIAGQEFDVQPGSDTIAVGDDSYALRTVRRGNIITVYVNEKPLAVQLPENLPDEGPIKLLVDAKEYTVEVTGRAIATKAKPKAAKKGPAGARGAVTAQMTGRVISVNVKPGDKVAEGQILLIVEAMKMENEIAAPLAGTVKDIAVAAGARVSEGDLLLQIEPES
jgi:biotin carboxyl carrier protein